MAEAVDCKTMESEPRPGTCVQNRDNYAMVEDPDNEIQAYLDHLLNDGAQEGESGAEMKMPDYYNAELFKKGQATYATYRFYLVGSMVAGLTAILAIPSMLKILMCTRQSSTPSTAYRRYVRTILHVKAWYDYPPTDSRFWTSLKAVRKAHEQSSRDCVHAKAGQITQKDLVLSQFGIIGFLTLGAHRIQLYDDEFLETTSHMWRVIGYLVGIKDEYNICGANWAETKKRLQIVNDQVYVPALEKSQYDEDFKKMASAMLVGLWPTNITITVGSYLFFTKRLAYVTGYEYYDFDVKPGTELSPEHKRYYYDLDWVDRFAVTIVLFVMTYMHKHTIVRWFLNLYGWFLVFMTYYLPLLSFWKYGMKWSYVRIFKK